MLNRARFQSSFKSSSLVLEYKMIKTRASLLKQQQNDGLKHRAYWHCAVQVQTLFLPHHRASTINLDTFFIERTNNLAPRSDNLTPFFFYFSCSPCRRWYPGPDQVHLELVGLLYDDQRDCSIRPEFTQAGSRSHILSDRPNACQALLLS
jgi:hypothetical protein